MTRAARKVLEDCRVALQLLEEEQDLQRWRIHWAAAVALTRAVGHVLDKVDGDNPKIKAAARAAFARWKIDHANEIFREFIEGERNAILKGYRFSHHPSDEVDIAVLLTLRHPVTGEIRQEAEVIPIGENIYRPMLEGFREGDDARDVLSDALEWWTQQLDSIDAAVAGGSSSSDG